jgi:DNA polymerase-4
VEKIIFHIDANNAFLSWSACELLKNGHNIDIRTIASAIAGDKEQRSGIILAKSEVAKKCGVKTAETIGDAKRKCPNSCMSTSILNAIMSCSALIKKISINVKYVF